MSYRKNKKSSVLKIFFKLILVILLIGFYHNNEQNNKSEDLRRNERKTSFDRFSDTRDEILVHQIDNHDFREYFQDNKTGGTCLHLAARADKPLLVKHLLKQGSNINALDKRLNTPLHLALANNSKKTVPILLEHNPRLDLKNKKSKLPIHIAAENGFIEVVKATLKAGISIDQVTKGNYNPLHYAAMKNHFEIVMLLVENGARLNERSNYGWTAGDLSLPHKGKTAIYLQIKNAHFSSEILEDRQFKSTKVIREKKNTYDGWHMPDSDEIKNSSSKKEPELFASVYNNRIERLKQLQAGGKDFDALSDAETPLLSYAILNHKFAAANIILDFCKNIDAVDFHKKTPLINAIEADNKELALKILKKGANPNCRDILGNTALHFAIKKWHNSLVPELILNGAEIFAKNDLRQTPLHFAVESNNRQIIEFLIKNGCDINQEDIRGNTALHIAVVQSNFQSVKLLTKNGANPSQQNFAGKTPVKLVSEKNLSIKTYLEDRSEIEGQNPIENAPAEIDIILPKADPPMAEAE
jgi:ankyrin repeat protein